MVKENKMNSFWKFLYGIEDLPIPEKGKAHFTITGHILSSLMSALSAWNIDDGLIISDPIKNSTKIKGFIKYNIEKETLAKHIKSGKLSINAFNAILFYYYFSLTRSYNDYDERQKSLVNLITFFDTLDATAINAEHVFFTNSLLNYLLIKIGLPKVLAELQPNFKLSFFEFDDNNEKEELFKNIESTASKKNDVAISQSIRDYRSLLKNEFKEIRFGYDSLPVSIEDVVELPFFIIDKIEVERRDLLIRELESLKENNDIDIQATNPNISQQLQDEINKINEFLNKKNKPLEVLNSYNDIFISSPAGTGKTTTLKWFTYKLSMQENVVPIFIELQFYNSNFIDLINSRLKRFNSSFNNISTKSLILLLDGFDEYSGKEEHKLIQEIKDFKKIYNCQIILSGRYKPIGLEGSEFQTYKLSNFNPNNIHRILNKVFPEKGQEYFENLERARLLEFISIPLHLIFLISHLGRQGQFELRQITILLKNKGKLFKKVLIDDFLKDYENTQKAKLPEHKWKKVKSQQIDLISKLAYYLTFEQEDIENVIYEKAIEYLENISDDSISPQQLIDDFHKHSILSFKGESLGFEIKEIRLFFAANYLTGKINSIRNHKQYRKKFKGDTDSFYSIETYLFGLISPSKIMEPLDTFIIKKQFVYNNKFIRQLEYALKFIESGNNSKKFKLLDKLYLLNTFSLILFNDLRYRINDKSKPTNITSELFFFSIRRFNYIGNYCASLIPRINNHFLHFYPFIQPKYELFLTSTYEMSIILSEDLCRNHFEGIKMDKYEYKNYNYSLYENSTFVDHIDNTPNLLFSIINSMVFSPIFESRKKPILRKNFDYKQPLDFLKTFLFDCIFLYPNEYLSFYFKTHSPTSYNLKTLYEFFYKNEIKLHSNTITLENKKRILSYLTYIAYNSKGRYGMAMIILNSFNHILDYQIKEELLDKWSDTLNNKNTSSRIVINVSYVFYRLIRDKDIPLFIKLSTSNNKKLQYNGIYGLSIYVSQSYYSHKNETVKSFQTLHSIFLKEDLETREMILKSFTLYKIRLPKYFVDDILKIINDEFFSTQKVIEFYSACNIEITVPYLLDLLNGKNILSIWAYNALCDMDPENFYKLNNEYLKNRRKIIINSLENLNEGKINNFSFFDFEFFEVCQKLGGYDVFTLLQQTNTKLLLSELHLPPNQRVLLKRTLHYLESKISRLKRTDRYWEIFRQKNNL